MTLKTLCSFRVGTRVCGRPCIGGVCERHIAAKTAEDNARREAARPDRPSGWTRYGSPQYVRNAGLMKDRAWASHEPCCKIALGTCIENGRPFASRSEITAEHLVPKRDGGTDELSNLAPCHSRCNSSWRPKGERVVQEVVPDEVPEPTTKEVFFG